MAAILVIDDDKNLRGTLRELLESDAHEVTEAHDGQEGLATLQQEQPDVVLCDWRMPGLGGIDVLKQASTLGGDERPPIVVLTAFGDGESAADAMQAGAYDFLIKPVDAIHLKATVSRALEHRAMQKQINALESRRFDDERIGGKETIAPEHQLIGRSAAWIEVFKRVGQVAQTDVTVLLSGETGTGKEVIARAIHSKSHRRDGPLVAVNCAAIPAELAESELFGHERGSFTGAVTQKKGRFDAAQGGTLFLDEIGELPPSLQPKLLRALQERCYERVGGTQPIHADFRVIAATNRNLSLEVEEKRFRADLYYRLSGYNLRLPPLRARRDDILPLAEYFLERFAHRNQSPRAWLAPEAKDALVDYAFPGNVRELEHLVDRLAVSSSGRAISATLLRSELQTQHANDSSPAPVGLEDLPFHESVAAWEHYLIQRALRLANGNKSEAARRLGIQRRLLYERLENAPDLSS